MTGFVTGMAAQRTRHRTGLGTRQRTFVLVTGLDAFVTLTGHGLAAGQAAAEGVLVARDSSPFFVLTETPLFRQHETRLTGPRMTLVIGRMAAIPRFQAGPVAFGRFRAAGDGRVRHARAALAKQLLEAGLHAGPASARMARHVTSMQPARQRTVAGQQAHVLDLDAALLVAFVLAAQAFLCTFSFARHIVGHIYEFLTSDLFSQTSATTPNHFF